jgi:hypothetical protein
MLLVDEELSETESSGDAPNAFATIREESPSQPGAVSNHAFESLKETIYREVAVFIALNESRPNFLVQLIRELQCLTTDYLRHRSLNFLHDLIRSVLTDNESDISSIREQKAANISRQALQEHVDGLSSFDGSSRASSRMEVDSVSNSSFGDNRDEVEAAHRGSSESSFDEPDLDDNLQVVSKPKPKPAKLTIPAHTRSSPGAISPYDYEEKAVSASSIETPSEAESEFSDAPFAKDSLGDTIIHAGNPNLQNVLKQLDEAKSRPKSSGSSTLAPASADHSRPQSSSGRRFSLGNPLMPSRASTEKLDIPKPPAPADQDHDSSGLTQEFRDEIEINKDIVIQVARFLLQHSRDTDVFTESILSHVTSLVVERIVAESADQYSSQTAGDQSAQLQNAIRDSLIKYIGQPTKEQSEAILRDISDILYDEMIFNKVIKQIEQSYTEEIAEMQSGHEDLSANLEILKKQRDQDLTKLQKERWQRLRKGNRTENAASTRDTTDDEQADTSPLEVPKNITAAQLSLESDQDDDNEHEVTLDDLPAKLDTNPALAYVHSQQHGEQQLAPDEIAEPSAFTK